MQDRRCFVEGNYTFFCNRVLPCRLVARRKYPQAVTFATARNDDEVEPAGDWAYFFFPYIFQTFTALHLVAITTSHEVASRILITCILYLTVSSSSCLCHDCPFHAFESEGFNGFRFPAGRQEPTSRH